MHVQCISCLIRNDLISAIWWTLSSTGPHGIQCGSFQRELNPLLWQCQCPVEGSELVTETVYIVISAGIHVYAEAACFLKLRIINHQQIFCWTCIFILLQIVIIEEFHPFIARINEADEADVLALLNRPVSDRPSVEWTKKTQVSVIYDVWKATHICPSLPLPLPCTTSRKHLDSK